MEVGEQAYMMSGDDIMQRVASRRGCELVDRLFPLSMYGQLCDAAATHAVHIAYGGGAGLRCCLGEDGDDRAGADSWSCKFNALYCKTYSLCVSIPHLRFQLFRKRRLSSSFMRKRAFAKMTFYSKISSVSIQKNIRKREKWP